MLKLESLNFHHLLYFWTVAREGSVTVASQRLNLTQPSVSMQVRKLERALGERLLRRSGRGVTLTRTGSEVFRYADEIFNAGQALVDFLHGRPLSRPLRLSIGVPDIMPKLITYRLLAPVFRAERTMDVECYESSFETLLADLAINRFDVVLSDAPASPQVKVRAFNHFLGDCGVTIYGVAALAKQCRRGFPKSLDRAPMVLPTPNTELRRSLDQWFDRHEVRPQVVGQFYDSALLKEFGRAGAGLFPAPTAIEKEVCRQYQVRVVGRIADIREKFYAITLQRRIQHPGVVAISKAARNDFLTPERPQI